MRVSRDMVFYGAVLGGIVIYCAAVMFAGQWIRGAGGESGLVYQALFSALALALLVWLVRFSPLLRGLRVFLTTHFYRYKYDYRVEWLRFVQMLATADDPDLRRTAINAVARIFGSPGGALLLRNEARDRFVLSASWPESLDSLAERMTLLADEELVRFVTDRQWVVDLREYAEYPQRYDHIKLPPWLAIAGPWRIIAPLFVGRDLIGLLVFRAPPEPFAMTFEDRDLLKTVGRHVAVHLAQRNAVEKLAESRQFDAYNRFAAFVMHDLKNSVAQLQLLVANAARHRRDPAFVDDAIDTIANTVERMTRLIEQLQGRGETHAPVRDVDFTASVRAAVARAQARRPELTMRGEPPPSTVRADPERLAALLDHVLRNAEEATAANGGAVWLEVARRDDSVQLCVSDEGAGMDEQFLRDRLFRPFDSTKGSKGMGIGAFQVREYVRSLGGEVEVQSAPGRGTRFCIRLPTCQSKNPDC
jgi:putative PEP-CTERM system histidine kinase